MAERLSREEIQRRAATFMDTGPLLLPVKPCPRCTPLGQSRGRGEVYIHVDGIWVKCSKCNGKGFWVPGRDA